jgi:hypothetical protein
LVLLAAGLALRAWSPLRMRSKRKASHRR